MSITQDVIDRTRRFEGVVPHMYLDTEGNVTVGVGHLLSNAAAAISLAFVDKVSESPVDADQKSNGWQTVSVLPKGHTAAWYADKTSIKLLDDVISDVLSGDLAARENQLRHHFAGYDAYPATAQAGLVDMVFNLGMSKLISGFPTFVGAVKNKDWATAAAQCHRLPPVSETRNREVKRLFLDAASGFREQY